MFSANPSGRSLAGTEGSNHAEGHRCMSFVSVLCCQVEVSATGRSLVQRSPTDCGVSEGDAETSMVRRSWPQWGCCATGKESV